jgi:IS30 family transposase
MKICVVVDATSAFARNWTAGWQPGTSYNTNGVIEQYLPKRTSLAHVTQRHAPAWLPPQTYGLGNGMATLHVRNSMNG